MMLFETSMEGEILSPEAVGKGPMIETSLICMHPSREHNNPFEQHPPPFATEHSIVDGGHFGG